MVRNSLWPSLMLVVALSGLAAAQDKGAQAQRDAWSLRPRSHPVAPTFTAAKDRHWIRNRVDAFVLAALQKQISVFPCGWPAAASRAARSSAPPMPLGCVP